MEKEITKSLIDKNIDSFTYNPQILVNQKYKSIKNAIISNLRKSDRVDIAVSYVVWSGLSLIFKHLNKFDKKSRILLTTEGFVTDPRSLRKLLESNISVKVYNPYQSSEGFHLKSYMFEKKDQTTILVGSNNISSRAFGVTHEMAIEVNSTKEGYIIDNYKEAFDYLWNHSFSVELTEEFIKGYESVYQDKQKMDREVFELGLQEDHIKPNYMQKRALEELEICRETSDRGLVIAATGTGKTFLSAFDVKNTNAKKVLFLVHNRLILSSAIDTYKRVFPNKKISEISSKNLDDIINSDIIFTTDKTAHRHIYKNYPVDFFDYIIYDEAHRVGSDTLYDDLINYFKPNFMLGITATPERTDSPGHLFSVFQYNVPYEIRLLDAMEYELVCPFTYYGLNLEEKLLDSNQEFNYVELAKYLAKIIEEKGFYGSKLRALLFASNIKEARAISNELNQMGFVSKTALSDRDTEEEIENHINSLKSDVNGSVEFICTVNKFNEGVDIPDINTIIMLRNTTSSIIYLQQLGRGLRKTNDPHKYVTVFDIIGNSNNNYSIAQVLTGNTTVDKRKLLLQANDMFESVSPFINVEIEKKAIKKVISSIASNFKVENEIRNKFKEELYRYETIPSLKYMYNNSNFSELELLELLHRNFYIPFEKKYVEKYNIKENDKFLEHFFTVITQFVFRGYTIESLSKYIQLLKGEKIDDDIVKRVLLPKKFDDGISTSVNSNYEKNTKEMDSTFLLKDNNIYLNPEILTILREKNAYDLYLEHIELFEERLKRGPYKMKTFDLIQRSEFLFNSGANDCYMNAVGEMIDKEKKIMYGTIEISNRDKMYTNEIEGVDRLVYYTQGAKKKSTAEERIKMFLNEGYQFKICAKFPHLGYSKTTYFNLGELELIPESIEESVTDKKAHNYKMTFKLKERIPSEFLEYKDMK